MWSLEIELSGHLRHSSMRTVLNIRRLRGWKTLLVHLCQVRSNQGLGLSARTCFLRPWFADLTRLRLLITSVFKLMGRARPCSLRNRPHALQSTEPDSSRRHSGVVDVSQFWQTGCVYGELWSVNDAAMIERRTATADNDKEEWIGDKRSLRCASRSPPSYRKSGRCTDKLLLLLTGMLLLPDMPGVGTASIGWKDMFGAAVAEKDLCRLEAMPGCPVSCDLHLPHLRFLRGCYWRQRGESWQWRTLQLLSVVLLRSTLAQTGSPCVEVWLLVQHIIGWCLGRCRRRRRHIFEEHWPGWQRRGNSWVVRRAMVVSNIAFSQAACVGVHSLVKTWCSE